MTATVRTIVSGEWASLPGVADYRWAMLGDILVERLIWGWQAEPQQLANLLVAQPGYVWFRFWLPRDDQVVERYYDATGRLLGTHVDVCAALSAVGDGWATTDLLLDIWIWPDGRVTVRNEQAFERAVAEGVLTPHEAQRAETQVRALTLAIAQKRFPPALVRNWQLDIKVIREALQGS